MVLESKKWPYGTGAPFWCGEGANESLVIIRLPWTILSIPSLKDDSMSDNSDSNIATADALTLLLHNQHALAAAIEEVTKWLSENGAVTVAENALAAMETLDENAKAITDAVMHLRQF